MNRYKWNSCYTPEHRVILLQCNIKMWRQWLIELSIFITNWVVYRKRFLGAKILYNSLCPSVTNTFWKFHPIVLKIGIHIQNQILRTFYSVTFFDLSHLSRDISDIMLETCQKIDKINFFRSFSNLAYTYKIKF